MAARILIVEDDADLCRFLEAGLQGRGFELTVCPSAERGLSELQRHDFDLVLTDVVLPGMSGLDFCRRCNETRPDVPVVVMTAFGTLESAILAIRVGAYDFLTKPLHVEAVLVRLNRVLQERSTRAELKRLQRLVGETAVPGTLLGESAPMRELKEKLARIAQSEAAVLITGESGTGKELVARVLHEGNSRRSGPLIAVNCSALPEHLLESEMFGHKRGAFTDARTDRKGLFVAAAGGTLFLDEIGELPLGLQPKILRALEEKVIRPIGATEEIPVDFRLLAATNRDLETAVEEGRFREDLFYRINVFHVETPPLRARGGDVLLLALHFLHSIAESSGKPVTGFTQEAAERLAAYNWPGNVRELRNCVEHAVALCRFDQVTVDDLPERIREHRRSDVIVAADNPTELVSMEEVERRYMNRVLEAVGGNRAAAARILGVNRRTLYRKLDRAPS